jgi:phage shock protein PspC (stress-responsive transcriptional regulator)
MNIKTILNRVHRSANDRMLGGVCAGFAEVTETPPWVWRAGFAFAICFFGSGALLYLILWVVMPVTGKSGG